MALAIWRQWPGATKIKNAAGSRIKVKERRTASGAVRRCPLCRGASRSTRTFALKGEMA